MSQAERGHPGEPGGNDLPASSPEALDAFGFDAQANADAMEGSTAYGQPANDDTWVGFDAHGAPAAPLMPDVAAGEIAAGDGLQGDVSPGEVVPATSQGPIEPAGPDQSMVQPNPAAMDWRLASPDVNELDTADTADGLTIDAVQLVDDQDEENLSPETGSEDDTAAGMLALDIQAATHASTGTSASDTAHDRTSDGSAIEPGSANASGRIAGASGLQGTSATTDLVSSRLAASPAQSQMTGSPKRPARPAMPSAPAMGEKSTSDHATIDEDVLPADRKAMRLQRRLQGMIPFAASLLLHLGLLAMGLALVQGAITPQRTMREQIIIPEARLSENGLTGAIPNPGLQEADPGIAARSINAPTPELHLDSQGMNLAGRLAVQDAPGQGSMIGLGPGQGAGLVGDQGRPANGLGQSSMGAAFGVPGGSDLGSGLHVKFMGMGGNAKRIVILCDASATMMLDRWKVAREEIKKTIRQLKPVQSFNIILIIGGNNPSAFRTEMVMATEENRNAAIEFIDKVNPTGGVLNPTEFIKAAFRLSPELLFVLSDGFDETMTTDEVQALGVLFDSLNPGRKIKVNILIARKQPDESLVKMLEAVAKSTGGAYKRLDLDR